MFGGWTGGWMNKWLEGCLGSKLQKIQGYKESQLFCCVL